MATIGVRVELEGAPAFKKSMSELTQVSKLYQQQLKTVEQTMGGVTNAYSRHVEKTKILKQAQQNLETQTQKLAERIEQLEQSGRGESQYANRLRTQYSNLQGQLAQVGDQIQAQHGKIGAVAEQFRAVGDAMQNVGGKIEGVGTSIMKFSTPIYAAFGASVKVAMDWESSFVKVMKTVDESAKTSYKDIEEGIKQLSTQTTSSKDQIAEVAAAAGQLGVPTDDILKFTETMIKLGDTTNISAEEAAVSLAKFLSVTGDGTGNVDKLGASIVTLGNNFETNEADIVNMSQRLAAAGRISGLTSTDILALATSMSSVGIEAEAGGTAMSQTLTQISKAVASGGEDLNKLAEISGMTAEEFANQWKSSPITALESFIDGLGKMNSNGQDTYGVLEELGMSGIRQSNMLQSLSLANGKLSKAVKMSRDAYKSDNETKEKANALSKEASAAYDTEAAKVHKTKENISNLGIAIGNKLMPIVEKVLTAVNKFVTWFSKLSSGVQDVILVIAGIIAALGPLIKIVGTVITFIGKIAIVIANIISFMAPVIEAVSAFVAALNPVTIIIAAVIAAIAAVIAIIVALWHNCEGFREAVINIWNAIKEGISTAIQGIKDFAMTAWQAISDTAQTIFGGIAEFFTNLWNGIKDITMTVWNAIKDGIKIAWDGITLVITTVSEVIKTVVTTVWDAIKTAITTVVNAIKTVIETVWNAIKTVVTTVLNVIQTVVTTVWNAIKTAIQTVVTVIQTIISTAFNIYKTIISTILEAIKTVITTVWNVIQTIIQTALDLIKAIMDGNWNEVLNIIKNVWENIKQGVSNGIDGMMKFVKKIPKMLFDVLGNLGKQAFEWGKDLLEGFIKGVKSKINDLKNAIGDVGNSIKERLHFSEPDVGPLKNFNSWAPDMMKNYVNGILDNRYLLKNAVNSVAGDVAELAKLNNQQLNVNDIYSAVQSGASNAEINVVIGDRELARKLKEMGVVFE